MIRAKCPRCGMPLKAPDSYAGQPAQCPNCQTISRVPARAKSKSASAMRAAAAKPKAKSRLKSEVDQIAGEPTKRKAAARSGSSLAPAVKAKRPAKGRPVKPLAARRPAKARRKSNAGLYVGLVGLLIMAGLAYFLWISISEQQQRQQAHDEVATQLQEVESAVKSGDFEKAKDLFDAARRKAKTYRRLYADDTFKPELERLDGLITQGQYISQVAERMAKAQAALKQNPPQYKAAQAYYKEAQRLARRYYSSTKAPKLKEYENQATKMLQSDQIRMGAQGLVFYDGRWMRPEVKTRLEMAKKGMVFYNGKWMKSSEVAKLKAQAEAAKKAKLAKAKPKPKKAPAKPRRRPARARRKIPQMDGKADVWMLDNFENQPRPLWRVESWASPGKLSFLKQGKNTVLKLDYTLKGSDKCAIRRYIPIQWPFETRDECVLDVNNLSKSSVQLTIAFFTRNGRGFYESRGRNIRPGETKNVVYDLRSKRFKCAETGWANKSPLKDPQSVTSICLMIYPRKSGSITFDNIRLVKKGKR